MKIVRSSSLLLLFGLISWGNALSQSPDKNLIESSVPQSDVEMSTRFLSADEFMGRETGTQELKIAGRYIANWFKTHHIIPIPGYENYFQEVPFKENFAPAEGSITLGDSTFSLVNDFVVMNEERDKISGSFTVINHGFENDISGRDLEGKIVITNIGAEGQTGPQQWSQSISEKNRLLMEAGAAAVIELYQGTQMGWPMIVNFMHRDRLQLDSKDTDSNIGNDEEAIPHIWLTTSGQPLRAALEEMQSQMSQVSIIGRDSETVVSNNVVGYIEGTDPELKNEHILLSAHYDHIGVNEQRRDEGGDFIYNGARDNAVGTTAIMLAGRYFADHPPRRSILIAAWTAEEIGLQGSGYFASNPMVPLEDIVYNMNIDGAGYNDTTKVTVIGLGRTGADEELKEAAASFGLNAIPDPVPDQNLFDRSDNVHFARQGIPAPTYSMGITAFDDEINQYYHSVSDESDSINFEYVTRYIRSYIYAVEAIANRDEAPFWQPGDPYEEAGKELYGRE